MSTHSLLATRSKLIVNIVADGLLNAQTRQKLELDGRVRMDQSVELYHRFLHITRVIMAR